jgi:hypothetical protein
MENRTAKRFGEHSIVIESDSQHEKRSRVSVQKLLVARLSEREEMIVVDFRLVLDGNSFRISKRKLMGFFRPYPCIFPGSEYQAQIQCQFNISPTSLMIGRHTYMVRFLLVIPVLLGEVSLISLLIHLPGQRRIHASGFRGIFAKSASGCFIA